MDSPGGGVYAPRPSRPIRRRADGERPPEARTPAQPFVSAPDFHAETILERITDGGGVYDRDFRYLYLNPQAEKIIGRRREELIGKTIFEINPDLVGTQFDIQSRRAFREQTPIYFEEYYPSYDNWMSIRLYPHESGLISYFCDITARKRGRVKNVSASSSTPRPWCSMPSTAKACSRCPQAEA